MSSRLHGDSSTVAVSTGLDLQTHQSAAGTRSALYGRLADVLAYPTVELTHTYETGALAAELTALTSALPYPLTFDADVLDGTEAGALGREFTRVFDVPIGATPCPLYGGVLVGDRQRVMEELLRYYRHFGLSTADAEVRDLPDAVPAVLEFLCYLAYRESEVNTAVPDASGAGQASTFRRAQHDILDRHVTSWTPIIRKRVGELRPPALYEAAVALLDDFTAAEHTHLA